MSEDTIWLTYDELASQLGVKRESARQLASRKKWARQRGSDGKARVAVPDEALRPPISSGTLRYASSEDPSEATSHATDAIQVQIHHVARLEHALAKAEEKILRLEGEREMAQDMARQANRELQAARADARAATVKVEALQKALAFECERATVSKVDRAPLFIDLRAYLSWWRKLEGGAIGQPEDVSISPKVPYTIRQLEEAFVVIDADGREVCFVYFAEDARISTAGRWSREKARAIAGRIARISKSHIY